MKFLHRILTGGDEPRAARNVGWLFAEKGVRLGVGFVVMAWVARYLGPRDFGLLSYCAAAVSLLAFLPGLGLDPIVKRDLMQTPALADIILSTAARLRLLAAVAAGLLLLVVVYAGQPADSRERLVMIVTGITLVQPALFTPELWFQANSGARYIAWAQAAAVVAMAGFRALLIWARAPLVWFAVALVGEMAIGASALAWFARRQQMRWWQTGFDGALARRLLREAAPLLAAGAAVMVYMRIDQVMLRQMAGEAETGVYAAAVRIAEMTYFVPVTIVAGLLPYWSARRTAGGPKYRAWLQRLYDLQAAAAYAFAIPVALGAPWLVGLFYGAAYRAAAPVLALLVWAGLFVFIGVARSQEWVFEHLNHYTFWTTVAGAVANIALNWWWIPRYGGFGAAGATVVSYAGAAWLSSFCFRSTRAAAVMQSKALLLPLRGWHYLVRP